MQPQYRQGDLLFICQETKPDLPLTQRGSMVIAAGETTGHAHRLAAGALLEAPNGGLYLEITISTEVLHEEHGPILLDPGWWLVVCQREYSPEAIRTVRD